MTMTLRIQQQRQRHDQAQEEGLLSRLGLGNMETTDWAWLVIGFVGAVLSVGVVVFIFYRCKQRCDSRGKETKTSQQPSSLTTPSSSRRGCCRRGIRKGNSDHDDAHDKNDRDNKEQPRIDPTRSESESSQGDVEIRTVPGLGRGRVNHNNNVENVDDNDDTWSFSMASYSVAIGTGRENDDNDDDHDDADDVDYGTPPRVKPSYRYQINDDDTDAPSWDRAAQKHYEVYEDQKGRTLYNI